VNAVRVQGGEGFGKGGVERPPVMPEGSGGAIPNPDECERQHYTSSWAARLDKPRPDPTVRRVERGPTFSPELKKSDPTRLNPKVIYKKTRNPTRPTRVTGHARAMIFDPTT
jgi:hypothetical protein